MADVHHVKAIAVAVALLGLGAGCSDSDEQSLEITNPEDGATLQGNVVEVALEVSGIDIVAAEDDPGEGDSGQFHVFIDRDPVAPGKAIPSGEPDVVQTAANPIRLTGLSVGEHRLAVVLGDKDNKRIGDAAAETTVRLEGPSVDVTGPSTAEVGNVIQVEIAVEGVNLVEAGADESSKEESGGQLHLFVNKEPTAPGKPIPTDDPAIVTTTSRSVAFPADLFKEGKNTIWVMLGQLDNTAFDPPVLDKVEVEVS